MASCRRLSEVSWTRLQPCSRAASMAHQIICLPKPAAAPRRRDTDRLDLIERRQVRVVVQPFPARAEHIIGEERHDLRHLLAPRITKGNHTLDPTQAYGPS